LPSRGPKLTALISLRLSTPSTTQQLGPTSRVMDDGPTLTKYRITQFSERLHKMITPLKRRFPTLVNSSSVMAPSPILRVQVRHSLIQTNFGLSGLSHRFLDENTIT